MELLAKKGTPAALIAARDATRKNVVAAMSDASLLHFAGHGTFGERSVWDSVLPLADSGGLRVGDILALPSVPRAVVLSGCETAETSELSGQQLGLAQAFVINGADVVIAVARSVSDDLARRMSERIHRENAPLPQALRRAQLAIMKEMPGVDWAAFRAIVP
jgi:CHAT domain-containing protein